MAWYDCPRYEKTFAAWGGSLLHRNRTYREIGRVVTTFLKFLDESAILSVAPKGEGKNERKNDEYQIQR